jgi:hypothetical protein
MAQIKSKNIVISGRMSNVGSHRAVFNGPCVYYSITPFPFPHLQSPTGNPTDVMRQMQAVASVGGSQFNPKRMSGNSVKVERGGQMLNTGGHNFTYTASQRCEYFALVE